MQKIPVNPLESTTAWSSDQYQLFIINQLISEACICSLEDGPESQKRWLRCLQCIERRIRPKLKEESIKAIGVVRLQEMTFNRDLLAANRTKLEAYENELMRWADAKGMLLRSAADLGNVAME